MRKLPLYIAVFVILCTSSVIAQNQKIGFFESDFILSNIPEYAGIEQRLQLLSDTWQQEIEEMEAEITALEEDYQAKEILYTEEIRAEKKREIEQKKSARDAFLNEKFGPEGDYFKSQDELLEPIMRQIFTAVSEVARKQGFDFVFDRTGDIYMVYARNEWNLNESILIELGIDIE
ncbi:MAG: OmpH family outer membrane protein [Balneolaceae bacterium]|jgi:outer membrane protein|nr:OmpH family outer membrane protein [Balneolaceae bacterium]